LIGSGMALEGFRSPVQALPAPSATRYYLSYRDHLPHPSFHPELRRIQPVSNSGPLHPQQDTIYPIAVTYNTPASTRSYTASSLSATPATPHLKAPPPQSCRLMSPSIIDGVTGYPIMRSSRVALADNPRSPSTAAIAMVADENLEDGQATVKFWAR
jgi:hypothetical protein